MAGESLTEVAAEDMVVMESGWWSAIRLLGLGRVSISSDRLRLLDNLPSVYEQYVMDAAYSVFEA